MDFINHFIYILIKYAFLYTIYKWKKEREYESKKRKGSMCVITKMDINISSQKLTKDSSNAGVNLH